MEQASTEGADVLGALGVYVVQGLALEALHDGGSGLWFGSIGVKDMRAVLISPDS